MNYPHGLKIAVEFLITLLPIHLYGSLLILIIFAVRKIAGYKFSPCGRMVFWILIGVWILCSLTFLNQFNRGWTGIIERVFSHEEKAVGYPLPVQAIYMYIYPQNSIGPETGILEYTGRLFAELYRIRSGKDIILFAGDITVCGKILWHVYQSGILLFLVHHVIQYIRLRSRIRSVPVCTDPYILELVYREKSYLGITKDIRVRMMPDSEQQGFSTPFVTGFLWSGSEIIVPTSQWRCLNPDERQAVVLHELMHIRHHDNIVNVLCLILQSIFWINPVYGVGARMFQKDRECFRDQQIANEIRTRAAVLDYAQTIITVAKNVVSPKEKASRPVSRLVSGELTRRMEFLLHPGKTPVWILIILAVFMLLVIAWADIARILFPLVQSGFM